MDLSLLQKPAISAVIFSLLLAACNSGSVSNNATDVPAADQQPSFRVSRIAVDIGGDGSDENVTSYTYDDNNRVMITSYSYPGYPDQTSEHIYTYVGNNLKMITDDDETTTFSYDNERLVLIEETYEDPLSYVYDDAGRLIELGGDRLFFDSDCLESEAELTNTSSLTYSLSYENGRVSSITGVYGDVVTFTYRPDGRIDKLIASGECSDANGLVYRYIYDTYPGRVIVLADHENNESAYTIETLPDGRIDTVTYSLTSNEGTRYSQSSYSYNTNGLLAARTVVSSDSDFRDVPLTTTIHTYTYEPFPCVRQISTDPFYEIVGTVTASVQPAEAALNCAYRLGY